MLLPRLASQAMRGEGNGPTWNRSAVGGIEGAVCLDGFQVFLNASVISASLALSKAQPGNADDPEWPADQLACCGSLGYRNGTGGTDWGRRCTGLSWRCALDQRRKIGLGKGAIPACTGIHDRISMVGESCNTEPWAPHPESGREHMCLKSSHQALVLRWLEWHR